MVKRKTIQRAALSAALSLCIAGGAYGPRAMFAAGVQFSITDPAWGAAPKVGGGFVGWVC